MEKYTVEVGGDDELIDEMFIKIMGAYVSDASPDSRTVLTLKGFSCW